VRSVAARNLNTSGKGQKHILTRRSENAEGSQDDSPLLQPDEYVPFLAALPLHPARSYGVYARHADPVVRAALASNPLAPTALLKNLVDDSDVEVRLVLAKNSWVDPAIYAQLSNDPVPKVRAAIARQPRLSREQQLVLATDSQLSVRSALARNKNCNVKLLQQLASDEKSSVRKAVAVSSLLTKTMIEQMSEDDDARVRESLWKRTDLPISIREFMNKVFGERPVKKGSLPSTSKLQSSKRDKSLANLEGDALLLDTVRAFKTFFYRSEYDEASAHLLKVYETLPYERRDKLIDLILVEQKELIPGKFAKKYAAILPRNPKPGLVGRHRRWSGCR
jgi:hypothetical protein